MQVEKLMNKIHKFNSLRGWDPSPSDTAKSVVIEGAELLELHQWSDDKKEIDIKKASHEVADVFWYLTTYCQKVGIDFTEAVLAKLKHNEAKYPESEFKGTHNSDYYYKRKSEYRSRK